MEDLLLRFPIAAPAQAVYTAISSSKGIKRWWTTQAMVETHEGGESQFVFPDNDTSLTIQLIEMTPFSRIHWRCTAAQGLDWAGTEMLFIIKPDDAMDSTLHFVHEGMTDDRVDLGQAVKLWQNDLGRRLMGYLEMGELDPRG